MKPKFSISDKVTIINDFGEKFTFRISTILLKFDGTTYLYGNTQTAALYKEEEIIEVEKYEQ